MVAFTKILKKFDKVTKFGHDIFRLIFFLNTNILDHYRRNRRINGEKKKNCKRYFGHFF